MLLLVGCVVGVAVRLEPQNETPQEATCSAVHETHESCRPPPTRVLVRKTTQPWLWALTSRHVEPHSAAAWAAAPPQVIPIKVSAKFAQSYRQHQRK